MNELFYNWLASFGVPYKENLDGSYNFENWDDKTVPNQSEIESKKNELDQEWQNLQYQRDRASQYPSIQDQLDMQYHDAIDGTTTWKNAVAKVKADNPKP